ncbi:TlpA family protein disulfide reductase [Parafrigoribacterium humi]|uniref:TlpA family protein disulfide reductase n=1 Tax=Parafrigoribacterium humi TaxID=3144664 RepID=UPI0032EF4798
MNALAVFSALFGLVACATALGLLWRAQTGRVRAIASGEGTIDLADIVPDAVAGSSATLLQFSTEVCAPCRATHVMLGALAERHSGVAHVDVDITRRADLASRFRLLQSPTTLILDGRGVVRARIGGAPRPAEVAEELGRILGRTTVTS